jgi:hypothetical protein
VIAADVNARFASLPFCQRAIERRLRRYRGSRIARPEILEASSELKVFRRAGQGLCALQDSRSGPFGSLLEGC